MKKMAKLKGDEKMKPFTFRLEPEFLGRLKAKADMIPLSAIIRRLLEKWLAGDIGLD